MTTPRLVAPTDPQGRTYPNEDKNWPFLFSLREGRWYTNVAPQKSKAEEADEVGEAKW
jgi:hypothetical protein